MGLTIAILVFFGVILMILETVLPGMITGIIGGLCVLVGVLLVMTHEAFDTWPLWGRTTLASGIILGSAFSVLLWMKVFGKTFLSRMMTLDATLPPAPDPQIVPVGTEGVATTDLRPLGKAEFTGDRYDVRCEDGFAPSGTPIRVTGSEPGNLLVRISILS